MLNCGGFQANLSVSKVGRGDQTDRIAWGSAIPTTAMEFAPVLWNPMHDASSAVPAQEIHFMASQNNRNVPSEKNQMSTQVSNSNNTRNHKQHASERIMTMTKPKSSCGKPGLDVSRRPQYVSPNVQQLNMRNSTEVRNLRGTMRSEKHTHNTETTKPSGPCQLRERQRGSRTAASTFEALLKHQSTRSRAVRRS